ncbi:MAG: pentapeptide repeat-containing protein, partial [Blastocatellia bacterium]
EAMPDQSQPTAPNTENTFVCGCGEGVRSACKGEEFFKEHEGKRYCVLHYPGTDKLEAFRAIMKRKLDAKDFDFRSVWFPEEADFSNVEFSAYVDLSNATFSAYANFERATFSADAKFERATFNANAYFERATFSAYTYFNSATFKAEADFIEATFSANAYFYSATFSAEANFRSATFSAKANFWSATFSAEGGFPNATFNAEAEFDSTTFNAEADFYSATFNTEVGFNSATFNAKAGFNSATFNAKAGFNNATCNADADFYNATFNADADFYYATFYANADFSNATFKNYVSFAGSNEERFLGKEPRLDFQFTHIEKPERVSFHTLSLKPHWFINADCRKFELTDCDWNFDLKEELEGASEAKISAPHRLLSIAYRQLADNAEANHRYHEASRFRYNAFEARRIEKFWGFVPWRLDWWYWLASGYGERVLQAFVVFVALFALFAFGYTKVGFDQSSKAATTNAAATQPDTVGKPLGMTEAIIYSAYVSILQKPEPKPLTPAAKSLVWLETILGPAQAALLALAVRRRFMR